MEQYGKEMENVFSTYNLLQSHGLESLEEVRVITQLPNSEQEQSYKGKVTTHKY
jgi:hypothetical protein